jgi:uncharacterized protein (DUF983 family)
MTAANVQAALPQSAALALWRGFRGRCPACGEDRMFGAFLKVADRCPHCGEELHHHRADDFPAYLVIVIVGHLIVPMILVVEATYAPPLLLQLLTWLPLTIISALLLLQPIKGAVVGLQWQLGMHGFETSKLQRFGLVPAANLSEAARAKYFG